MKYYTINRKAVDFAANKDGFLSYNKYYFLDNNDPDNFIRKQSRSSNTIEKQIKKVLDKIAAGGTIESHEVVRFLAWKVGKINHVKSDKSFYNTHEFVYTSDWENAEQADKVKRYNHDIKIHDIKNIIYDNQDKLIHIAKNDPDENKDKPTDVRDIVAEFLNELIKSDLKNHSTGSFAQLGSVYMLSLLYLLSGGKYPIYDQYAFAAIKALLFEKYPFQVYVGQPLMNKDTTNKWINESANMYAEYLWFLKQVFGTYTIKREEDQALWVYGHLTEDKLH